MANFHPRSFSVGATPSPVTLSVGRVAFKNPLQGRVDVQVHVNARFKEVSRTLLKALAPDVIFSPLVDQDFDVYELASRLEDLKFKGSYFAIADVLPCPAVILDEVAAVAPSIQFDVIVLQAMRRFAH